MYKAITERRKGRMRWKMKRAHENVFLFHWAMDNRTDRKREKGLERTREQERERILDGLAIKEGMGGMESAEKVELKEEDHRKRGRVIVEGGGGGKSDVWRERECCWRKDGERRETNMVMKDGGWERGGYKSNS